MPNLYVSQFSVRFFQKHLNSKIVRTSSQPPGSLKDICSWLQQAKELPEHSLRTQLLHVQVPINLRGEFLIPTCNSLPPHGQVKCCYHCHFLQEALFPVPLSYCGFTSNTYPPSTHIPYNRSELVMHLTSPLDHKLLKGKDHIWLVLVCFSCLVKQQVLKYGRSEHWVI